MSIAVVPGMATPVTSSYNFPVKVTVSGGTITSITINDRVLRTRNTCGTRKQFASHQPTGAIVNVTISDGTMTAVVINGATAGAGAGVYQ